MTVLLEMQGITKKYGDFTANHDIHFDVRKGEIHALVGENGAGKTTMMRMLYGMEQPTAGRILVNGKEVHFHDPSQAIRHGIGMVHQHFMLFPSFTLAENIVIGGEPKKGAFFDRQSAADKVRELGERYGMPIDPWKKAGDCPLGIQQRTEILKVLYQGADVIILDEPTGVLTPGEVKELLAAIKGLAAQGKSFILITHKLHEVMEAADRITVLRDGVITGQMAANDTDEEQISRLMVGRELVQMSRAAREPGEKVLDVQAIKLAGGKGSKPLLDDVSLSVRRGEIVGIAGISGNGQSELLQVISGLRQPDRGTVELNGADVTGAPVRQIREQGLAHIPEDRYLWGASRDATVLDNGLMGHQQRFRKRGLIDRSSLRKVMNEWVQRFAIKTGSLDTQAQFLSGGNLQKLIAAREFAQQQPFLIAAEPTRGVDVGAMELIHGELLERCRGGDGILLVSSELTEILKLSDRILVMYEGRIAGELTAEQATEEQISLLMAGGKRQS